MGSAGDYEIVHSAVDIILRAEKQQAKPLKAAVSKLVQVRVAFICGLESILSFLPFSE